mgnify:CR=1 FL=1
MIVYIYGNNNQKEHTSLSSNHLIHHRVYRLVRQSSSRWCRSRYKKYETKILKINICKNSVVVIQERDIFVYHLPICHPVLCVYFVSFFTDICLPSIPIYRLVLCVYFVSFFTDICYHLPIYRRSVCIHFVGNTTR